ncbi:hypothetical protein OG901_57560 [Streptomyces mirabilis]|nr:hypothetical protein [Streptomyces sp. S1D4-23]MCX5356992.1 hypothetical protein [Streptomyces mirabilis]
MTLGKAALELAAEVVLVPDDRLPGVNGEDVWRGIEHVAQRFALVRLGPGECEHPRHTPQPRARSVWRGVTLPAAR